MIAHPKSISFEFLKTNPEATKQEAIRYANQEFPHSPLTIAEFMAEWESLRDRYREAKLRNGDFP
jgi:hypothetical protein